MKVELIFEYPNVRDKSLFGFFCVKYEKKNSFCTAVFFFLLTKDCQAPQNDSLNRAQQLKPDK